MKIRNRITLWVSLAGLASTVVLSLIVFFWGLETPYEFLDQELEIRAHTLANELEREQADNISVADGTMESFSHLYWARIYNAEGQPVFTSQLAREIEMPLKLGDTGYLIRTDIPLNRFYAEEDDQPTAFWNRVFTVSAGGVPYRVHVARPVENLVGESIESALMIGSALLASALILIVVSYQVAGKILHPVREINRLTAEITAKTLATRLPLAGNRDEIDELAASLNEMFNRLHFSFRRQREFVANASHELKTPITLLRLSMEEMLQDEQLPLAVQEKLLAQERALARISQLVKSLLDLSRLEMTESLEKETFSLNDLLASVAEEFQPLMQEQTLRFTSQINGALPVHADREKIRRMLINLLDNAIRYNQPEGEIRCQVGIDEGKVTIVLANTGPGIDRNEQSRIFDQFYRCEKSRATAHGGSGLGLTIVKRIVELHSGSITVESGPSTWTTFTVVFPSGLHA
jgi:signal transduction histidine kinase